MTFLEEKNLSMNQECESTKTYRRGYQCPLPLDAQCLNEEECPCARLVSRNQRMPIVLSDEVEDG